MISSKIVTKSITIIKLNNFKSPIKSGFFFDSIGIAGIKIIYLFKLINLDMNYILFDDKNVRANLLPLTDTRPICELRMGILTIREKWELYLGKKTSTLSEDYLAKKYPMIEGKDNILIRSNVLPNPELLTAINALGKDETLIYNDTVIALRTSEDSYQDEENMAAGKEIFYEGHLCCLKNTWEIFSKLEKTIPADFELITKGRKSAPISKSNNVIGEENIFIEEGAVVEFTTINAKTGPVYIGKDAEIMEGAVIRGPFALCEGSQVKMLAKIYGPTTIGPFSKVGGELSNVMFLGYGNKAHDGFIGNSVIGEWCNIGADTNVSNLKNTYDSVRLWNYEAESFVDTGLQFCGVIMGDHTKTSINVMLNTGTVIGVNVNLFGAGFPRNFIPSFSWGGASSGFKSYNLNKAFEVAERVYARRGKEFDDIEKDILRHIYKKIVR